MPTTFPGKRRFRHKFAGSGFGSWKIERYFVQSGRPQTPFFVFLAEVQPQAGKTVHTRIYCYLLTLYSIIALSATAAEPNLKTIMQGLRDDVVEISDGLLTDDFAKVAQGATRIANHARIPADQVQLVAAELGTEMAAFKQFDTSVHDLSLSIAAAAEEKDHDRAIADYQRMLNGCFACHGAYKDRVGTVLSAATGPE